MTQSVVSTPFYSGPVIQITQWESSFDKNAVLREDWYLAKNIGMVKITQKRFGQTFRDKGFTNALNWDKDDDYYASDVKHPMMEATLVTFDQNKYDY